MTAGNWTNDPLEIEATVDVPAGWTTQPVRVTVPPGRDAADQRAVTPAPVAFPEPGVQPEVTLTGRAAPVGGGKVDGAPTATVWVKPDPTVFASARDAGTPSSVVIIGGYTRLAPDSAEWVGTPPSQPRSRRRVGRAAARPRVRDRGGDAPARAPARQAPVALLRGDVTAATGPLIVKADGTTLVAAGPRLQAREFAWERFVLDGGPAGRTVDLTLSGSGGEWKLAALLLDRSVLEEGGAGGTVPATLSLTFGAAGELRRRSSPASNGPTRRATTATVISTAGDATLTASGPVRLRNGAFSLAEPLAVTLSRAIWDAPVSNDEVTIGFRQQIGANEPLRSGTYSGTVTFTLATTNP